MPLGVVCSLTGKFCAEAVAEAAQAEQRRREEALRRASFMVSGDRLARVPTALGVAVPEISGEEQAAMHDAATPPN